MQLRPYQQAAVDAVYEHLRSKETNPCVVIPCGCGKSLVLAQIAKDSVEKWNGRVLILAHVKELLEQNADKIRKLCPELKIGIEYDGDHHRTDKMQWRRDVWKRRQLESMGWTIVAVTQLDLSDEPHRAALAMNVAMIRARKSGHPVALHTPVSW